MTSTDDIIRAVQSSDDGLRWGYALDGVQRWVGRYRGETRYPELDAADVQAAIDDGCVQLHEGYWLTLPVPEGTKPVPGDGPPHKYRPVR